MCQTMDIIGREAPERWRRRSADPAGLTCDAVSLLRRADQRRPLVD